MRRFAGLLLAVAWPMGATAQFNSAEEVKPCLLYTSDDSADRTCVELGVSARLQKQTDPNASERARYV